MAIQRVTLKPSLMVAVVISRAGGVSYVREALDSSLEGVHEVKSWKVTKDVPDIEQLKKADAIANECRRKVSAICYRTAFGWVAPKESESELQKAWDQVKVRIVEANQELTACKLVATCVKGEVMTDDREAAEAILRDIGQFFTTVQDAIARCDVKAIRQTIADMRGIDTLLDPEHSKALKDAVATAKQVAKTLKSEVEKKGQEISAALKQVDMSPIDQAMVMFVETGDSPQMVLGSPAPAAAGISEIEHPIQVVEEAPEPVV